VVGLFFFSTVSFESLKWHPKTPNQYFWWSSIRLNSDPLNRYHAVATPCREAESDCASWDPASLWISPGLATDLLILTALPAFVVGMLVVRGLGRMGVSEVWTFMVSMPLLIGAWYYAVGWLIDRRKDKRRQKS
jgi:hypothetical protein